jgi:hypothetical protein
MSLVPSIGLTKAFHRMRETGRSQYWGEWKLLPIAGRDGFVLVHYGTTVARVEGMRLAEVGGWSASDRDAINGLCRLIGDTTTGASISGGCLRVTVAERDGAFAPSDYRLYMAGRTWDSRAPGYRGDDQ